MSLGIREAEFEFERVRPTSFTSRVESDIIDNTSNVLFINHQFDLNQAEDFGSSWLGGGTKLTIKLTNILEIAQRERIMIKKSLRHRANLFKQTKSFKPYE